VKRTDLAGWHKKYFVPSNAALVIVGDITAEAAKAASEKVFGAWKGKPVPAVTYPAVAERTTRDIIVVDRPASEQSVIYIGNLALARASADYVPLLVANQVLGGAPSSRLFMDLREKRSLSYGAYSSIDESLDVGPFLAMANVRNDVTKEALAAFFEHLDRIVKEAAPEEELRESERFLTDRFPLEIDSARSIAGLVSDLRIFGLPDGYWETYRSDIGKVTAAEALSAAQKYIRPDKSVVVVVGKAEAVVPALEAYGKVTVLDRQGKPVAAATK
jgi:zinc protease